MKFAFLISVLINLVSSSHCQPSLPSNKPYANPTDTSFHLILKFEDISSGMMIVSYESKSEKHSDTVKRYESGVYIFDGSLNEPQSITLLLIAGHNVSENEIFMENNILEITGQWHDRQSWTWKGSNVPGDYDEYQRLTRNISMAIHLTDSLIVTLQESNKDLQAKGLLGKIDSLFREKRKMTTSFIRGHQRSPVSLNQLILNFYASASAIEMKEAWDLLDTSVQNMPDGKYFSAELLTPAVNTDLGKEAPEIVLPDKDGKLVALSNLRGKYVLVDFWASWCVPCRKSLPELRQLYNKYKDKTPFELLSVSLDEGKESWLSAIREQQHTWTSLGDGEGFQSPAAFNYGVKAIPFTILIDPDGKILSRNPSISEIESILSGDD